MESPLMQTQNNEFHGSQGHQIGYLDNRTTTNIQGLVDDPIKELQFLYSAAYGFHKEDEEPTCHEGTRKVVLDEIDEWLNGRHGESVFWISGWAGIGKSTIARTVAKYGTKDGRVAASFFFSRKKGGDNTKATHLVTSIARQLAYASSVLKARISKVLQRDPDITRKYLQHQWQQLVLGPISERSDLGAACTVVVIVDALDECCDKKDIDTIVQMISGPHPENLRLLVASKPTIFRQFQELKTSNSRYRYRVLHTLDEKIVYEDILCYLRDCLGYRNVRISEEELQQLARMAGGLFIWAETALKFITSSKPLEKYRLARILGAERQTTRPEKTLDKIYLLVLNDSISPDLNGDETVLQSDATRCLLGYVAALYSELSPKSLYALAIDDVFTKKFQRLNAHETLVSLNAILDVPGEPNEDRATIRVHHLSFGDFLFNPSRCTDPRFLASETEAHNTLLRGCLRILGRFRDGYVPPDMAGIGLDEMEAFVGNLLTPAVRYACLYWVKHLQSSGHGVCDNGTVHQLLQAHALHWIEAMAWMDRLPEAIEAMDCLRSKAVGHTSDNLLRFVTDLKQITENHRSVLREAPLQIYSSALIFAPEDNLVRRAFGHEARRWVRYLPRTPQDYYNCVWVKSYETTVKCIAIVQRPAPLVIVATYFARVYVYEAWSGKLVWGPRGRSEWVHSLSVSPDSERLAISLETCIQICEATTGKPLQTLPMTSGCKAIGFTNEGKGLLVVSSSGATGYWELATETCSSVAMVDLDHDENVLFSQGGETMLTWSRRRDRARLWKLVNHECSHVYSLDLGMGVKQSLDGEPDYLRLSVAMSREGDMLVAGYDKMIKVFAKGSGGAFHCTHTFRIPSSAAVNALALAPDNRSLTAITDQILIIDTDSGQHLATFGRRTLGIYLDPVFSEGGDLLAFRDGSDKVKLWKLKPSADRRHNDNEEPTECAAATNDGTMVATGASCDIIIWSTHTGQHLRTFQGNPAPILGAEFLSNNRTLVAVLAYRTIQIWDVPLGQCSHVFDFPVRHVYSHAMTSSRDSNILVYPCESGLLALWDLKNRTTVQIETKEVFHGLVRAALSSDGSKLALAVGSARSKVYLWDTRESHEPYALHGHSDHIRHVAFSTDDALLATGSRDRTVRLWGTSSRECLNILPHGFSVTGVGFSGDGQTLVSIEGGPTSYINVWNFRERQLLRRIAWPALDFLYESRAITSVSDDGRFLYTHGNGCIELDQNGVEDSKESRRPICIHGDWVMRGRTRILWIPPEYREYKPAIVRGDIIVLQPGGDVLTILNLQVDQ
ncbi:quinon protein alcohol dehydrogenase-like superfamily [Aspergillus carlsbadensis]|nr:quinon protein alcohol dehydrogenase-like superfamily [Aspergillus carlsbadensis]